MLPRLAQVFHFSTAHSISSSLLCLKRRKQKHFLRYLTDALWNFRTRAPGCVGFPAGPLWILLALFVPVSRALAAETPRIKPVTEAQIQLVATGIANMEGWNVTGSLVRRYNNPGALKRGLRYLHFETTAEGWAALHKLVRYYLERGLNLGQLIDKWTPDVTGRERYRVYFHQLGLL